MSRNSRLELTWIGKDERPKLEPRILIEEPSKSHHAATRGKRDVFDNVLIKGDNLLALKSLEQDFTRAIKCIYIDPPYNTGSAFEYYDDGVEHSLWLTLMRDRLELLEKLLAKEGSIWISVDDNEYPYLRVLCDEIFGRANFVSTMIWEKRKSRENRRAFSFKHDYIVVYAVDKRLFEEKRNPIAMSEEVLARYRNLDNDSRGPWQSVAITAQAGHGTASQFYKITTPSGRTLEPPAGNCWRFTERKLEELVKDNRIYFGPNGSNVPRQKKFLRESEDAGLTPETIWYADDVGTNDGAKRHSNALFDGHGFDNPKPEELLKRIFEIATNQGDLVLDSFAGSGTSGAVAQKMRRRWIMVELGEHAETHIVARMRKVVDGTDLGGISDTVDWKGGGGFRYYQLAPSLIDTDRWGNRVISKKYNPVMLAEAMCKHLGFTYAPSPDPREYWKHGASSERDFIYVTTASLTVSALRGISEDVGPDRTLLVCCKAFDAKATAFDNLTLKKIPQAVLATCEWGRDDYSLRISQLPKREEESDPPESAIRPKKNKSKPTDDSPSLFDKDA